MAGGPQAKAAGGEVREAGRAWGTEGLVRNGKEVGFLPSTMRNHKKILSGGETGNSWPLWAK